MPRDLRYQRAEFGGKGDVKGEVWRANPLKADGELVNGAAIKGKIAIVERGAVPFVEKARAVVACGAVGMIVINEEDELFLITGDGPDIKIPVVCIKKSDGEKIMDGARVHLHAHAKPASSSKGVRSLAETVVEKDMRFQSAVFGGKDDVEGEVWRVDPLKADGELVNGAAIKGKIAIVERGVVPFVEKARAVVACGAVGMIVINEEDELYLMPGNGPDIKIPVVCIKKSDGEKVLNGSRVSLKGVSSGFGTVICYETHAETAKVERELPVGNNQQMQPGAYQYPHPEVDIAAEMERQAMLAVEEKNARIEADRQVAERIEAEMIEAEKLENVDLNYVEELPTEPEEQMTCPHQKDPWFRVDRMVIDLFSGASNGDVPAPPVDPPRRRAAY